MAQYFALEANQTRRELHVLYPVHHDAAGWFSRYLTTWMSNVGKLGVDSPYLDQLGAMPGTSTPSPPAPRRLCDFGPRFWQQRPRISGRCGVTVAAVLASMNC